MSTTSGIQSVLSRISTISSGPAAVSQIQARFGFSLAAAVTSMQPTGTAGVTTTPAPGTKDVTGTSVATSTSGPSAGTGAAATTTTTVGGATPATSTAPAGGLDGALNGVTASDWADRLPANGAPWAAQIAETAERYGIAPEFLGAVVWTESNFNPAAVSPDGAIGMGQLMPGTAAWLGVDPWDPAQNLDGAARYYRNLIDRFGSLELATASYFAGPTAVKNAGGIPSERAEAYVAKVLGRRDTLAGL